MPAFSTADSVAIRQLEVRGYSLSSADHVWSVAGQFHAAWHPAIATMQLERSANGGSIRAFTVHGEDTVYREQLIYHSNSDRTLQYAHLEGIAGADRYIGSLRIESAEQGGCVIVCGATIEAAEPRALEIENGTKAIFQMGIDALITNDSPLANTAVVLETNREAGKGLAPHAIAGTPALACNSTMTASGLLCLFLHGIGGSKQNWDAQLQSVAGIVQAVAMDLRGYGDSEPGNVQSSIDDYCDDILRVREAFGATQLILCGLSYGAWIATSFALRYPQMVRGLVLSGGCTGMSEASVAEREAFRQAREEPLNNGLTPADFASDVVSIISGPNASDDTLQQLLQSMSAISAHTYRDAINCFTRPPGPFDFSGLTMPVLMMTGEHDRLAPPDEIRGVACRIVEAGNQRSDHLSDVQFEVIADAGHVCNLENPDQYNQWLRQFLARVAM
jgi:pimeloyl-ACP methyl ester carboxylesterase